MTEELFRKDGYLKNCDSKVIAVEGSSVVLDRTVFYPTGGGQPGDTGVMEYADGTAVHIIDTQKTESGIVHVLEEGVAPPAIGDVVTVEIDWLRRHRLMRMHSCMHMLCSIVPFGVTGGSIREDSARLDFDAEEPMDKEALNTELNRLIQEDHLMSMRWISEDELDAQPELVRTMSVQPPRGTGSIRLVSFEGVDLQPCGGTHVKSTAEIGAVRIRKIEKKGKHNRRVNIVFDE
ncbi:MAG: alanyl-tRNA editing protein [Gammaproteobacteria bacterium]|jgi:misacylated tRNA(Ala) deacylase|nr:alanyl-tRNA editing protein [Gammaproteobacteria bacterium]MBT3724598.1 alanyl-tRNA editing protein [Gammaproteobacteria bacterium]MBT4077981.1 alanyl-tRNA editing protein [Gammaproteobacteria bacterium]MBT4194387.1 alanyl-tRNA editing protein [Gammaproteobacteria bacterium]MBT4450753.1 alanyl-tRNA editing protein [Gammaproteobacteria bacterium]